MISKKNHKICRLLPLASHYSAVVEWCEVGEVSDIGLVTNNIHRL